MRRLAVRLAPATVRLALLAVLLSATIQVAPALAQGSQTAPALAQGSGEATEAADTVQEQKPSIHVGHGSKGFEIGTSDGNYLLQLQLRVQLRYAYPFDSDPITFDDFSERDQHIFKVNRSRIKIGGNAYQPWLKYYMEYELGGNALLDYRLMLEKWSALRVKVGQWKAQYSRERIISSGRQQMMERSIINREFTIDRQQGVSLYGRLKGSGIADFNYWASVFTGMGRGAKENDDTHLMWMFRGQWNFLGREVPFTGSDWEYHEKPAAVLAFAAVTNQSPYTRFSTGGGGQLIGFEDGEPGQYRVKQWLQETAFKYRGFAWQQEFHRKEVDDKVNLTKRTLTGAYFQGGYFFHYLWPAIPKPLEVAARFTFYNPDIDRGGDLLREYVFAANWFFNGHLNKLTTDLTFFSHDFPDLGEQEKWRFRIQWDFST
jgi:phosphate-selective porin